MIGITLLHRELFALLTDEDRGWIVARVAPGFPRERVSLVTVASLDRDTLKELELRVRARKRSAA